MRSSGIQAYGGRLHLLGAAALGAVALLLLLPSQSHATSASRACGLARAFASWGAWDRDCRRPVTARGGAIAQRISLSTKRRRRDTTPPETTIASGPSGSTTATTASFGFTSSEAGASFACRIDAGSWAPCGSPKDYSGLAAGDHQFSVRATDAAGNTDASPAARSWAVSSPPPPTEATPPPPEETPPPTEEETPPPPPAEEPTPPGCTSTVSSVSAAQSALSAASPGAVVCLADGAYGGISLSSSKAKPGVTLRAANPGRATIGSVQAS
ncbi:MAG: hypothetical protein ACJ76B_12215, partial [Solirubrobacterales bacterium]